VLSSDYFLNKEVLDIGCNDGSFTILVAMKFFPSEIVGIDIDYKLINKAIDNLELLSK
jgi:7SK snRNA methylphosphate capping enzyme